MIQADVIVAILTQQIHQPEEPLLRRVPELEPVNVVRAGGLVQRIPQLLQEIRTLAFAQKQKSSGSFSLLFDERAMLVIYE